MVISNSVGNLKLDSETELFSFSLEGWVDYGEDETRKTMLGSGVANHQFDIFLENFKHSTARVRVIERMALSKDIVW